MSQSSSYKFKIISASIFWPLYFLLTSHTAAIVFAVNLDKSLSEKIVISLDKLLFFLFLVFNSFAVLGLLSFLRPLFRYIDGGGNREKAVHCTKNIPLFLVLLHTCFWTLGVIVFYAAEGFRTPDGIPFIWGLLHNVSAGIMSAYFINVFTANIILPARAALKIIKIKQNEIDWTSSSKLQIHTAAMLFYMLIFYIYILDYFKQGGTLLPYYPVMIICIIYFIVLGLFFLYLTQLEYHNQTTAIRKKISRILDLQGNLKERVYIMSFDKTGFLAGVFNDFLENVQNIIINIKNSMYGTDTAMREIKSRIQNLDSETILLNERCADFNSDSAGLSKNVRAIAGSSADAAGRIYSVTETVKEMKTGLHAAAVSAMEMSDTVEKTANTITRSGVLSESAAHQFKSASAAIQQLSNAVEDITGFTAEIKKTAEYTNLLALNATIEATSDRSDANRFSIVAGQIKELARQSEKSALDIGTHIRHVQQMTSRTLMGIKEIGHMQTRINKIISSLLSGVQDMVETSRNITQSLLMTEATIQSGSEALETVRKGSDALSTNVRSAAESSSQSSLVHREFHDSIRSMKADISDAGHTLQTLRKLFAEFQTLISGFET